MMSFGAIVGVGWITILGHWLERAGPGGSIVALTLGAFAMLLVAANYSLLARLDLLSNSGEIGAIARTLGPGPAFITTAALALACLSTVAFEAVSAAWIIVTLLPAAEGPAVYPVFGHTLHLGTVAIAVGGTLTIAMLNLRSISNAATAQNIIVLLKLAVTALLFIAGASRGDVRNMLPLSPGGISPSQALSGTLSIAATMPLWYAGFNVVALLAGERDPTVSGESVGRLMRLAIVGACAFYICIVLSASTVVPWQSLISAPLPAVTAYGKGLHSSALANAVLVAGLLGIFSAWISCFAASARVLTALRAQLRQLRVERITARPDRATIFAVALVGILLALNGRAALVPIVNVSALCFGVVYLLVSLVAWRRATHYRQRLVALLSAAVSGFMSLYVIGSAVSEGGVLVPEIAVLTVWTALMTASWLLGSRRLK